MFVDTAQIKIKAGKGGDGAISFHRDKYTLTAETAGEAVRLFFRRIAIYRRFPSFDIKRNSLPRAARTVRRAKSQAKRARILLFEFHSVRL